MRKIETLEAKRWIAFFLMLVMLVGVIPMQAFAEEGTPPEDEEESGEVIDHDYDLPSIQKFVPTIRKVSQSEFTEGLQNNLRIVDNPIDVEPEVTASDGVRLYTNIEHAYSTAPDNTTTRDYDHLLDGTRVYNSQMGEPSYSKNQFPQREEDMDKQIYPNFMQRWTGTNVAIDPDDVEGAWIEVVYPQAAQYINRETGEVETYNVKLRIDNIVYLQSTGWPTYYTGTKTFVSTEPKAMLSISNHMKSGIFRMNIPAMRMVYTFLDQEGNPVTLSENSYFTTGSLNGDPSLNYSEVIALLNAKEGSEAIVTEDTQVEQKRFNQTQKDRTRIPRNRSFENNIRWGVSERYPDHDYGDTQKGDPSVYAGMVGYGGFSNDFTDVYMSSDFYKNAVTYSISGMDRVELAIATWIDQRPAQYVGTSAWQFFQTATTFKNPPAEPVKTVSDSDETDVTENRYDEGEPLTYRVSQRINSLHEDSIGYIYDRLSMQDVLPENVEYVSSRLLLDGEAVEGYAPTYDEATRTVSFSAENDPGFLGQFDEETSRLVPGVLKYEGENLVLEIVVNTKEGSGIIENDATTQIDEYSMESNKVKSTPGMELPVDPIDPEIEKRVEGELFYFATEDIPFEYTIKIKVPNVEVFDGVNHFAVEDELEPVLDFVEATADVEGYEVTENGKRITVRFTDIESLVPGEEHVVTIKAVIPAGTDLSYYADNKVPNVAHFHINNDGDQRVFLESNVVHVTTEKTPDFEPEITKDVEGQSYLEVERGATYLYNVRASVPEGIEEAKSFLITDTLEDVLLIDNVALSVDGEEISGVNPQVEGQTVSVRFDDVSVLEGKKEVHLFITAAIREDADLSAYEGERVPNRATLTITNAQDDEVTKETDPVHVTPPTPEETEIVKNVEGKNRHEVDYAEEFVYNVYTKVPADLESTTSIVIKDQLEDVLAINAVNVLVDGQPVDVEPVVDGQLVTVRFTDMEALVDKEDIHVAIHANIKEGADLSAYENNEVPNVATLEITDQQDEVVTKESDPVHVVPPTPRETEVTKDVEGKDRHEADFAEVFVYNVRTDVPANLGSVNSVVITDQLEDVLTVGEVEVLVDGVAAEAEVTVEGQLVTVRFTDMAPLAGKEEIHVVIHASIKEGADLSAYENNEVPNVASLTIVDNQGNAVTKESDPVHVVPPTPEVETEVKKDVEGKDRHVADYQENFVYNVRTNVPANLDNVKSLVITDRLEDVLAVGEVEVMVDGAAVETEVVVDGQLVTVRFTDMALLEGKEEIHVVIHASLKADADVSVYENNEVPNVATLEITDQQDQVVTKESDPVVVTPPTPEENEITKDVEGKDHHVTDVEQDFVYNVRTNVPADLNITSLTITDQLEDVLAVGEVEVMVDGEAVETEVTVDGQLVTVRFEDMGLLSNKEEIHVVIHASVREDADLSAYENNEVPNVANLTIVDNQGNAVTKESDPVHVSTPEPQEFTITKDVEGKERHEAEREEEFVYNVRVKVPANLEDVFYFSVTDSLEEALAINSVEVLVDGEVMDVEDIIFGRLVVVPFADMDELAGKEEIHIQIRARILEDADLTMYENEEVPNTATLQVTKNGGNEETLESETVYVTPPAPARIVKRVEGQEEYTATEEEAFTYTVAADVPADRANLVSYEITDTLEEGLRYIDAKAFFGDTEYDAEITMEDRTLTVKVKDMADLAEQDAMRVVITVAIDDKAVLEAYEDGKLPNTAQLVLRYEGEEEPIVVESNTVYVSIPDEDDVEPTLVKEVEGSLRYNAIRGEAFTYTLTAKLPRDMDKYDSFVIRDDLVAGQEVVGAKVFYDGEEQDAALVTIVGRTVVFEPEAMEDLADVEEITIAITAKVLEGFDLSIYENEEIPNTARILVTYKDNPEEVIEIESNETIVTVPKKTPVDDKKTPVRPGGKADPSTAAELLAPYLLGAAGLAGITAGGLYLRSRKREEEDEE